MRLVPSADAEAYVAWLGRVAEVAADPPGPPPVCSEDPGDDYLVALAAAERAVTVSGDAHLTALAGRVPLRTQAEFLADLEGTAAPPMRFAMEGRRLPALAGG